MPDFIPQNDIKCTCIKYADRLIGEYRMKTDKISIIIPIYNGEDCLEQCKRCLLEQTYKDLEIIFVDDGSKDGSGEKLERMKEELEPFSVQVFHQENKGISSARNVGMELAKGEFITFMDQDDYMETDYIETLYQNIGHNDIVVSGYNRTRVSGKILRKVSLGNGEWAKFLNTATWGKLYRKEFIERYKIRFLNVVKGEDVYFTLKAYSKTPRIRVISYVGYHWIDHEKSVTNTVYTQINESTSLIHLFDQLYPEIKDSEYITEDLIEFYFIKAVVYDLLSTVKGKEECKIDALSDKLFDWLDTHFPEYYKNRNISFFRPYGEMPTTRFAVKCFFLLKRMHMLPVFLHLYSKVF